MNKRKYLIASLLVVLFALSVVMIPPTSLDDLQENEIGTTPDFKLNNDTYATNQLSALENGENTPKITTERHDIINETKPLKIWVKLENGKWYNSTDLTDLSQVTPENIVYYVIETPYGYVGYYVKETDTEFGHCPIVYSPILANGTAFKEPVGGMFLKLWVKAGGEWYQKYITSKNLGYDYRQYMTWEVIDAKTWQLGFNITDMEFTVAGFTRQFDIYVGIQVHQDDKFVNIKQQVTPKNDYQDIALEWQMLTAPNFQGTDLELSYVNVANETFDKTLPLNQFYDVTTQIPEFIKTGRLMGKNNVTYHTFNFDDLESYGLNGSDYFRVEQTTLPDGQDKYVCRVAATKGEGINAGELLDIDPQISISDEGAYYLITTGTYSIRITDTGGYPYYYTVNSNSYATGTFESWEEEWQFTFTGIGNGKEQTYNKAFTPEIIEDDSNIRVILKTVYVDWSWGGKAVNGNMTKYFYFYEDFFLESYHFDFNVTITNAYYSVVHRFDEGTANLDKYAHGNGDGHSTGNRGGEPTINSNYTDHKEKYLVYYDSSSRTELFGFNMIYDDDGEDNPTLPDLKEYYGRVRYQWGDNTLDATSEYDCVLSYFFDTTGGGSDPITYTVPDQWIDYITDDGNTMQTPVTGTYTGWDRNETLYELACDTDKVEFDLDCSTNEAAYYPAFKLTGYTDTAANFALELEGVSKTNGSDYIAEVDETNNEVIVWWNSSVISTDDQTFEMGVISGDTTAPTITYDGVPANNSNIEDGIAYNLNWSFDENANWTLYRNGTGVAVENNSDLTANHTTATDLTVGNVYNYTLDAEDAASNNATNTVFFMVVDTTAPVDDNPADESYEEGASGNSITWTITELNPNKYNITRNGTQVQNNTYTTTIAIDIDGLAAASYTFICYYNDTSGNSASDTVVLTVTAPSSDGGGGGGGGGSQGTMTIVVNYDDRIRQGSNLKITILVLDSSSLQRLDNVQIIVIFLANRTSPEEQADKSYKLTLQTKDLELGEYSFEVKVTKAAYKDARVTKPFTVSSEAELGQETAELIDTYGGAAATVGTGALIGGALAPKRLRERIIDKIRGRR